MASSNSTREISSLSMQLSSLLNRQLQTICAVNGLKTSGVKAELQKRIVGALQENLHADPALYAQLRTTIQNMGGGGRNNPGPPPQNNNSSSSSSNNNNNNGVPVNGYGRGAAYPGHGSVPPAPPQGHVFGQTSFSNYAPGQGRSAYGGMGSPGTASMRSGVLNLQFSPSPFYIVQSQVGVTRICEAMAQHRNSVHIAMKAGDNPTLQQCTIDKSYRVMVFCAGDDQGVQDVAFPHQSELKVNGDEIKANLRGLKGKPGTTRPVDITKALRLDKISYVNNVEFTYALTNKVKPYSSRPWTSQKFFLAIYICKAVPVEDLVARIKGKKIPKASVIQELTKAAHDPDIVATSQVLSLRCPLSYTRLRAPCRSVSCNHIQCFDATSYLQLQEQGPQWVCPVCSKPANFENLALDDYVGEILENTSESTEQVTIEPDGQWKTQSAGEPEPPKARKRSSLGTATARIIDDDDDVVALDDISVPSARQAQTPIHSMLSTPAPASANGSASGSRKRTSEVIDLTLSDDDDMPARAPKRQNAGATPNLNFPSYTSFT